MSDWDDESVAILVTIISVTMLALAVFAVARL